MMLMCTTQSGTNSAVKFQKKTFERFLEICRKSIAWLEDFVMFAANGDILLCVQLRCADICRKSCLIILLSELDFFCWQAWWCGRVVDEHSFRFDPFNILGLQKRVLSLLADMICELVREAFRTLPLSRDLRSESPYFAELLEVPIGQMKVENSEYRGNCPRPIGWLDSDKESFSDINMQIWPSIV